MTTPLESHFFVPNFNFSSGKSIHHNLLLVNLGGSLNRLVCLAESGEPGDNFRLGDFLIPICDDIKNLVRGQELVL
mgnify:CR=1 FL=1